jgi:hypothetical protein
MMFTLPKGLPQYRARVNGFSFFVRVQITSLVFCMKPINHLTGGVASRRCQADPTPRSASDHVDNRE